MAVGKIQIPEGKMEAAEHINRSRSRGGDRVEELSSRRREEESRGEK